MKGGKVPSRLEHSHSFLKRLSVGHHSYHETVKTHGFCTFLIYYRLSEKHIDHRRERTQGRLLRLERFVLPTTTREKHWSL